MFNQNGNCIAIGFNAGMTGQGTNAIAIGSAAGMTGQSANTIVINATGVVVNSATANACYVAPIRDSAIPLTASYPLYYNPTTSEINSRSTVGTHIMRQNTADQTGITETFVKFPSIIRSLGSITSVLTYTDGDGRFTNSSGVPLLIYTYGTWFLTGGSAAGFRESRIYHSGLDTVSRSRIYYIDGNQQNVSATLLLNAGEYFAFYTYQTSGTTQTIVGTVSGFKATMGATILN